MGGTLTRLGEQRKTYRVLVGKPEARSCLGGLCVCWRIILKLTYKENRYRQYSYCCIYIEDIGWGWGGEGAMELFYSIQGKVAGFSQYNKQPSVL